jgi:hypothetical protein
VSKDGSPFGHPAGLTEWLKSKTNGLVLADSVHEQERCCFCWRGSPVTKVPDHVAGKCPLLTTFNKYRSNVGLQPIRIGEGSFDASAKKEPVKAETVAKELAKEVKELKALITGLEKRLQYVEKKTGVKRKASDSDNSKPAKKRSVDTGSSSGTAKAPKASGSGSKKGKKAEKAKGK